MPTVLVTGASRGLGLELVRQYAADGWEVLACARQPEGATELVALAAQGKGRIERHVLDLDDLATIDALAARLEGRPIDVLLNSAGTMGRGSSSDFDDWATVLRVNVMGPMKMAEAFVEHVAASRQKKIVALSSVIGSIASNRIGSLYAYRASKAALNAVMRSLSIDLQKSHGIHVAPIHPGWVRTDMGGPRADIDAPASVAGIRKVIDALDAERAGRFWMYDGTELPW